MSEFDFDVDFPEAQGHSRQAYRLSIPGLEIFVRGRAVFLPVKDISATGMGIVDRARRLHEGDLFDFDLLLLRKPLLSGLKGRVMRFLPDGLAGCVYENLDPEAEAKLDKLILEVQKRLIARKRNPARDQE